MVSNSSQGEGTSSALTTSFSNMEGSQGEDSSVVFSDRSGSPILKNTGYVAIGTFKLSREQIELLSSASDLDTAFYQFGAATNFNSLENGAFQGSASGDPAELYDGVNSFAGSKVYIVIGNGSDLITSSEFLVWDSGLLFDGTGPTGGPWEVVLSVDSGDLIIGLSDKNTSDFSLIGGDAERGAFTMVMIDEALDDHGNSRDSATFITENSTTSGKIDDGADIDYFRVDLSEDGNLFVKINQNLDLKLYDGEGNLIEAVQDAGDGLGGGVAADFMISKDLAAGTYFVSVAGDENTSDVGYNLESEFEVKIIDLDPESAGSYYGLVRYKNRSFIGCILITITQDGNYSGRLRGMYGYDKAFKGTVNPDYSASISMGNAFGRESAMGFELIENAWGDYVISGHFQLLTENEPNHYFKLDSARYSKEAPVPSFQRGRYTMHMPSSALNKAIIPAGDGFASGTLWSGGWFGFKGRSNSGAKFTYSNPLLHGDYVPLFTRPEGGLEVITGNIWVRDFEMADLKGWLRYYRKPSKVGYYKDQFDEFLTLEGSRYRAPNLSELPLANYPLTDSNTVAKINGGVFDGVSYPVTWKLVNGELKSEMITTSQPNYQAYGQMNNKDGRFWGNFIALTGGENPSRIRTYYRGVVLQKKGMIVGQAKTVDSTVGRYSLMSSE